MHSLGLTSSSYTACLIKATTVKAQIAASLARRGCGFSGTAEGPRSAAAQTRTGDFQSNMLQLGSTVVL